MLDDRYKVEVELEKTFPGKTMDFVNDIMNSWSDGQFILCKVLQLNKQTGMLLVKLFLDEELSQFIGKTVPVKVCAKKEERLQFLADDKYNAEISLLKLVYKKRLSFIKNMMQYLREDEIIECEVVDINADTKTLYVKWTPNNDMWNRIDWKSNTVKKLVGKMLYVNVHHDDGEKTKYYVNNHYRAELSNLDEVPKMLEESKVLFCKIDSVDIESGHFFISWKKRDNENNINDPNSIAQNLNDNIDVLVS